MPRKIVITGASGFIGRQLVPRLAASGCELLVVGRNPNELAALFPGIPNCTYEMIAERSQNFDFLVHLAVLNSDASSSVDEFKGANIDLVEETLMAAKRAGIRGFVNLTTFHVFEENNSGYANSKRVALETLENENDVTILNIFLPAVYGDDFSGKLALVKKLPRFLQSTALMFVSALAPTVHVQKLANVLIGEIGPEPENIMLYNEQDQNPVYFAGKRLMDLLFAGAVIVLAGWLFAIIWVLVKTGSPGPGIFAQQRVGKSGVPFICYKFRTMKTGTKQAGTHELTADAITGIGAFLRKTKIDELPQVFNILRGELSLVGPRPSLPVQTELIQARKAHEVFRVLPGITGLAQINGVDMSDPERLALLDARYIAQRGLLLDLKIIFATFLGRGQGDKVRL